MSARQHIEPFDHHRGKLPLLHTTTPLRTGIFLAISFAGFLVVNAFWLYISSGRWVNLAPGAYWRDLVTPLGETFVFPLAAASHRWMIAVDGGVLALVIFVPVIISVLYRLFWAFLAVAMVAAIGHMPVLALTLALGCMLAGRTRLRSDLPFVATLLGLLPPALYLMLFAFVGSDSAALPFELLLLKAPLLVAIVSAVLAGAFVLGLAKLTHYRSGVVWPVVAVFLAGPMLTFYLLVGSDELDYNLLTASLSPTDTLLEAAPLEQWQSRTGLDRTSPALAGAAQQDLDARKRQLIDRCARFLARHDHSDRAAAVMWIAAQCADLQVDLPALRLGQLRYSAAYVSRESQSRWALLTEGMSTEPQAALAQWHVAELALREGDLVGAIARLRRCELKLRKLLGEAGGQVSREGKARTLSVSATLPRRGHYQGALADVRQLLWMLERVSATSDAASAQAVRAWTMLDPCQADYRPQLAHLVEVYEKTGAADYLRLMLAEANPDPAQRQTMLGALAAKRSSPAYIEANFELGELLLEQAAPAAAAAKARDCFRAVVEAPDNPWKDPAQEHLRALGVAGGAP